MQNSSFKYFLAVAETGSLRLAAARLHVSASAISRQIQNLEHEFKSELFERRASGMELTAEGRIVEEHMRRTLREMELAQAKINDLRELTEGNISYAAIEGVASAWIFPRIAQFQKAHPAVTFSGRIAASNAIYQALSDDQVDFGFALLGEARSDIKVIKKYQTSFKVAMSPSHPLAGKKSLNLKDLAPYSLAMLNKNFQTRQLVNSAAAKRGVDLFVSFELDHIELLKSFVRSTDSITILPDYAILSEKLGDTMAIADIPPREIPDSTTALCIRKGRRLTHAAQQFIDSFCDER